ncbi:MAG: DEAD/DEAH box helicase [Candidatus Micrarchaeota archaeon]
MLREEVLRLVKAKGFTEFTDVQKQAFPLVERGENLLIIAPTGGGKTEAVMLPLLSKMLDLKDAGESEGIQLLYITPLRALNRDMLERLEFWCKMLGLRLGVRHGDTSSSERTKQRDNPPQLLITTPETLQSLLIAPKLSESLKNVRFVVVDEVHELVDSKRGLQLSLGLERLREKRRVWGVKEDFQLLGVSATVGNEREIASFLSNRTQIVKISLPRLISLVVEMPQAQEKRSSTSRFSGLAGETSAKLDRIVDLIDSHNRSLVFVNTRYTAESIASLLFQLSELREKLAVHHSSLSRESRLDVEKNFKAADSSLRAIICTSSLELGIDVGAIDLVVQYVSPRQATRLVQRVGRSGHRLSLTPKGVVLATDALDALESGVICKNAKAGVLESQDVRENPLDVLGHQLAGLSLDFEEFHVEKALELCKRAFPFRNLELSQVREVLKQLSEAYVVSFDGWKFARTKRTKMYYYENVSTIPDEKRYFVKDAATRKNVGVLDEDFVAEYLQEGRVFITRGRAWKVLSVADDEIAVEQTNASDASVPDWVGEEIPVGRETAGGVAKALSDLGAGGDLSPEYCCDKTVEREAKKFALRQAEFFLPSQKKLIFEAREQLVLLHSLNGNKVNEAISRVLSSLFSSALGHGVRSKASTYGILFEFPKIVNQSKILAASKGISSKAFLRILESGIRESSLFRHKFVHVAKRMGVLRKDSQYKDVGLRRVIESFDAEAPVIRETLEELFYDKLDSQGAFEILSNCEIILLPERNSWSPLARTFLEFGGFSELFIPAEPTEQIINAFKNELLAKKVRLLCLYCGRTFGKTLSLEKEDMPCPYCNSKRVTLDEFEQVWRKKQRDSKEWKEMQRISSLVASYGMRALLALETYGVGAKNASRVLSRLQDSEEAFFKDLLEAQKTFIRTRKYWQA